jgi:DMSO/TMAO reductase YedYZ molybdopterin-dependent catalytic subunit
MKRDDKSRSGIDRRNFIRTMGSGSAIAAAAPIAAATEAHAYDPGADERKARYRETDDVKAFYRTNGYETLKK